MKRYHSVVGTLAIVLLVTSFGCRNEESTTRQTETPSPGQTTPAPPTPAPAPSTTSAPPAPATPPQGTVAARLETQVDTLTQRLDALQDKIAALPADRQEAFTQTLRGLQAQKEVVQERVEAIKEAPADGWQILQSSTEEALKTLQRDYEQLAAQIP